MIDSKLRRIVQDCLEANYGLQGDLLRLPGENINFLLTAVDGRKHVAKVVDEHMPPPVIEMEFAAMEYAANAGFRLKKGIKKRV